VCVPVAIGEVCITWAKPHKESHLNAEIYSRRRDSFFKVKTLKFILRALAVRAGTMVNHFRCQREKYIEEEPWILYIIERERVNKKYELTKQKKKKRVSFQSIESR
jgi:hypothetical protein